jgi:protocatechuate 3,4-dioxygenase beta subunit
MKGLTKLLAAAVAGAALVLVLAWRFLRAPEDASTHSSEPAPASSIEAPTAAPDLAPRHTNGERVIAGESKPDAAVPTAAKPPIPPSERSLVHVRGRTLDVQGHPVSGVGVGVDGQKIPLAKSDASGAFDIDIHGLGKRLVAIAEEWVTVRYDVVDESNRDREHFLIVAAPISLAGNVADASGRPLAGATVEIDIPIGAFVGFPLALDSTGLERFATKSGAGGSFELKGAPFVERAKLVTSFGDLESDVRPLPSESVSGLYIELKERAVVSATLEGVVVHEDGSPAEGARVILVDGEAKTDAQGRFRLELRSAEPETPLVAILKGFQPAVLPEYGRVLRATDGHPPPVRLVLGPPPLSIAGHVLDTDGKACPKWTVALAQGTGVSQHRIPVITAENLSSGAEVRASTDGKGAFRLSGLRNIAYQLRAWGKDGRMIQSEPIQAGSEDVVLRTDPEAWVERISGRVVSRDGIPLEDLTIGLELVTYQSSFGLQSESLKATTTRSDGTFEFERVPRRFARLSVHGEAIQETGRDLERVDLGRPIEIVVLRMCRFRFESEGGAGVPTRLSVLEEGGRKLGLVTREAGTMRSGPFAELTDGKSLVLTVSEEACRLVLYKDDEVLSSQPLRLTPGEITTVRTAH